MNDPASGPEPEGLRYRPRRLLTVATVASAVIVVGAMAGWIALGPSIQARFTGLQLATLILFIALAVLLLMSLALSEVRAGADALSWRNGLRSHRVPWSEVVGIRFLPGDPWAYALTAGPRADDPIRHPLFGIQSTDRELAVTRTEELRAYWNAQR